MKPLCKIILIALVVKTGLSLMVFDFDIMNHDEESNYATALEYVETGKYPETAFYGSGTVFLYQLLIWLGVSKKTYLLFAFIAQNILYAFSIYWFYRLTSLLLIEKFSIIATLAYSFYPSVMFYIGALFRYENIAVYCLIFVMWVIARLFTGKPIRISALMVASAAIIFSCYIRGQLLPIYLVIFIGLWCLAAVEFFWGERRLNQPQFLLLNVLTVALLAVSHYPILKKNENIFGARILSTQVGYELLQGHNPTARGSWMANWREKENPLYVYSHEHIPGLGSLNEYEESVARKELALEWIKNNPVQDLKLNIRKLAIYFLPYNFDALPYAKFINPLNLAVHLLFFLSILFLLFKKQTLSREVFIFLLPIAGSMLLTLAFFVGYRWRFYAEPFMIILSVKLISYAYAWKRKYVPASEFAG